MSRKSLHTIQRHDPLGIKDKLDVRVQSKLQHSNIQFLTIINEEGVINIMDFSVLI